MVDSKVLLLVELKVYQLVVARADGKAVVMAVNSGQRMVDKKVAEMVVMMVVTRVGAQVLLKVDVTVALMVEKLATA